MGKIALAVKPKKADDVGCHEDSPSPTKTAPEVPQYPSPTPKHPLIKTKAGCCRSACLFSLGVMMVLILVMSTVCLVDYQQGNLATHTSQLQKEVREFPRQVLEVLSQTPKDLHKIFITALNWTRMKEPASPRKNNDRSPRFFLTSELLHEIVIDQSKEDIESSVPNGDLPKLDEKSNGDTHVDEGIEGVTQFFLSIWKDVTGMFAVAKGEKLTDDEVINNAIERKVDVEESLGGEKLWTVTGAGHKNLADQVHSPGLEHAIKNEVDWNIEDTKVMEEVIDAGKTEKSRDQEALKNLLSDEGSKKHFH